ncbi:hypothetical protein WJ972_01725 [Achromobacter insuavis]
MEKLVGEGQIDYLHASLYDLLAGKPQNSGLEDESGKTTAEQFIERVAERLPLLAAGQIRTPDQARSAVALGLPLVAVGKGLVMNARWVELAQTGRDVEIDTALNLSGKADDLQVPDKLWSAILATPGWFPVRDEAKDLAEA